MKNGLWVLCFLLVSAAAFAEDPADPFLAADQASPAPALPPPDTSASASTPSPTATVAPQAQPSEQTPIPVSSIPGKTKDAPSAAGAPKDIYDEYADYLEKTDNRQSEEDTMKMRARFPHENGGWQIGLEYIHRAFGEYNWNAKGDPASIQGNAALNADTQGLMFSFGHFPLRSMTLGRFGVIAQGGVYLTKFIVDTPQFNAAGQITNNVRNEAKRQSGMSYGLRAVYEFQYWIGQLFVPYVTAGLDMVRLQGYQIGVVAGNTGVSRSVLNFPAQNFTSQSYGAGLHFNLNRVEPLTGSRSLVNVGVKKFYLSYLALQRIGALSGLTHSLGLRFEF